MEALNAIATRVTAVRGLAKPDRRSRPMAAASPDNQAKIEIAEDQENVAKQQAIFTVQEQIRSTRQLIDVLSEFSERLEIRLKEMLTDTDTGGDPAG